MRLAIAIAMLAGLALHGTPASAGVDCEPARCAVQAAIDLACSCDGSGNHGRYVSCVARVVRSLAAEGVIPTNCKGKVKRCAARSTCGKPGFVTCRRPVSTCDPGTLTCANDPTVSCSTDLDCGSRCSTKRSAELCEAIGGVPGGTGSCCSTCVTDS